MIIWAAVPVKRLDRAKQRLADALDPPARAGLVLSMLDNVLTGLLAAEGLAGIVVVTDDPEAAAHAAARGIQVLPEPPAGGLNQALAVAAEWLEKNGAEAMLVVPADLPLVRAVDFTRLIAAHRKGTAVTLVRSKDGGTGALLCALPPPIAMAFGPDSFAVHALAAKARGLHFHAVDIPHIAFDLDAPEDLAAVQARQAGK